MAPLLFLLLTLPIVTTAISCPYLYQDKGDGTCYMVYSPTARNSIYNSCAKNSSYLYDIQNAFENSWVQQQVGYNEVWLGMTCIGNNATSCIWDNGTPITATSYTNFAPGAPNINLGPCVKMNAKTGQWLSGDCSNDENPSAICKYAPGNEVPYCDGYLGVFRGDCYTIRFTANEYDDTTLCASIGGQVASIHNFGVNQYILNLAQIKNNTYIFTGLVWKHGEYRWKDNTTVDYTNFGYNNTVLGSCVSMALTNSILFPGQWINTVCVDDYGAGLGVICKRSSIPSTPSPTQTPTQCNGTQFLSDRSGGLILSPGYPRGSERNICKYMVLDNMGITVINFEELALDSTSKIELYYSLFEDTPFATLTNIVTTNKPYKSDSGVIVIVFTTQGSATFNNFYSISYGIEEG